MLIHILSLSKYLPSKYLQAWEIAQKPQNKSQMAIRAMEKMKGWGGTRSGPGDVRQDGPGGPLRKGQPALVFKDNPRVKHLETVSQILRSEECTEQKEQYRQRP